MATRKQTPARKSSQDATEILTADHKKVSKIFAEFEKIKDSDSERKLALVKMACDELTVHAQIEEEIFYPAVREAINEKDEELLDEAEVEHETLKRLVETLRSSDPDDHLYDANMKVLAEYVKHHVKEEQDEMFVKARKAKGLDLKQLGEELSVRKAQLMEEYGIEPEESSVKKRAGSAQRHA